MAAITDATDAELEQYRKAIVTEQERRRTLASAGKQMDDIARAVLAATGQEDGGHWVQPTDATNAYPQGWTVTYGQKTFVSLTPANVWEPPTGWREVTEEGGDPPEWVQPTSAADAYNKGDQVTFEGAVYESVIDANTWSPEVYPAGWKVVS